MNQIIMQKEHFTMRQSFFWLMLILCFIGLGFSFELARVHYFVHTDPTYSSPCAINDSFNCETVALSSYALFLNVPVAVWGIFGYLLIIYLLFSVKKSLTNFYALIELSLFSVVASITLALISYCVICSFCIYCSITYLINIIVFILLTIEFFHHKLSFESCFAAPFKFIATRPLFTSLMLFLAVSLILCFPHYWEEEALNDVKSTGTTSDGSPWLGTQDAVLRIEEFSDYMCPFCKKSHNYIRRIIEQNEDKILFTHHHFPLDQACNPLIKRAFHEGACKLAKFAICAEKEGRFWEINDEIFTLGTLAIPAEDKINSIIQSTKLDQVKIEDCLNTPETEEKLASDINEGMKLNLHGTPVFLIDGKVFMGQIPAEIFQKYNITLPQQ